MVATFFDIGRKIVTSRYLNSPSLNTAHSTIVAFRERIEASSCGFLLANTPVCPRTGDPEGFVERYTFNVDDLLSHADSQVIVHHGAIPKAIAPCLHLLYHASPIIYAHRALGRVTLSLQQIRQIIEGCISDWGVLHHGNSPIRLSCHTGVVQKAVFDAVSTQIFGARQVRDDLTGCDSYEKLATRGREQAGSLVFGLRPEFASSELCPISIADGWPGLPAHDDEYPSMQVWLSVPRDRPVADLARYLELVAGRMEMDILSLRKLSERCVASNVAYQSNNAAAFFGTSGMQPSGLRMI